MEGESGNRLPFFFGRGMMYIETEQEREKRRNFRLLQITFHCGYFFLGTCFGWLIWG